MAHILFQSGKNRKRCRTVVDPITGRKKKVCDEINPRRKKKASFPTGGGFGGGGGGAGSLLSLQVKQPAQEEDEELRDMMKELLDIEQNLYIGEPTDFKRVHGYYQELKKEYRKNRSYQQAAKDVVGEIPKAVVGIGKNVSKQVIGEYMNNPVFAFGVNRLALDAFTLPLLHAIGSYDSGIMSLPERTQDLLKAMGKGAYYLTSSLPSLLSDPIDTVIKVLNDAAVYGIPRLAQEQALFTSALASNDLYLTSLTVAPKKTIEYTIKAELAALKLLSATIPYLGYGMVKGIKAGQGALSRILSDLRFTDLAREKPGIFSEEVGKLLAQDIVEIAEGAEPEDIERDEKLIQRQIFGPLRRRSSTNEQLLPEPLIFREDFRQQLKGLTDSMLQTPARGKGRINMLRIRSLGELYREALGAPPEQKPGLLLDIAKVAHELRYNVNVEAPAVTEEDFPVPEQDIRNLFNIEEQTRAHGTGQGLERPVVEVEE